MTMTITGVVDDGTNQKISWGATLNGVAVNPCNATVGPTAPLFLIPAGTPTAKIDGQFSMLRTYAQADDWVSSTSATAPGQPGSSVNLTTDQHDLRRQRRDHDRSGRGGYDRQAGHRGPAGQADVPGVRGAPGCESGVRVVRRRMSAFRRRPTRSPSAQGPRLRLAALWSTPSQCLKCHVGSLYQHGNTRVDNANMCVMCHNPASTEQNVRTSMGILPMASSTRPRRTTARSARRTS